MKQAFYPEQAPIDAYGNGGFRFAEMSHRGSMLCLPSGMHGWPEAPAGAPDRLDCGMLEAVIDEAGAIEVLLLGTGDRQFFLSQELKESLAAHGLVAETMATGAAARTYNVLLTEKRAVAAALIAVE